jgi:hypothetical protein
VLPERSQRSNSSGAIDKGCERQGTLRQPVAMHPSEQNGVALETATRNRADAAAEACRGDR